MASTRRRVKVYTLNEDRQWDDRGTGHVSSSYVERLQGLSIMVRSEEDGKFGLSYLFYFICDNQGFLFDRMEAFIYYLMVELCRFLGSILLESKIQPHTAYQKQQVKVHVIFTVFYNNERMKMTTVSFSVHRKR